MIHDDDQIVLDFLVPRPRNCRRPQISWPPLAGAVPFWTGAASNAWYRSATCSLSLSPNRPSRPLTRSAAARRLPVGGPDKGSKSRAGVSYCRCFAPSYGSPKTQSQSQPPARSRLLAQRVRKYAVRPTGVAARGNTQRHHENRGTEPPRGNAPTATTGSFIDRYPLHHVGTSTLDRVSFYRPFSEPRIRLISVHDSLTTALQRGHCNDCADAEKGISQSFVQDIVERPQAEVCVPIVFAWTSVSG